MEKAIHFGRPEVEADDSKRDPFLVRALDVISGAVMNVGLLLVVLVLAIYAISSH